MKLRRPEAWLWWAVAACGVGTLQPARAADTAAEHYTISTAASSQEVNVGDKGTLSIHIQPKEGRKVHDQAPLTVAVKAPKGLQVAKTKLGQGDVSNKGSPAPDIRVEFTAGAPGPQVTQADLQFFICTATWCERMQDKVSITVQVKQP